MINPQVNQNHRDIAEALLNLHSGNCSVARSSLIYLAFCEMRDAGKVTIIESSHPGYMNIHQKPDAHQTEMFPVSQKTSTEGPN